MNDMDVFICSVRSPVKSMYVYIFEMFLEIQLLGIRLFECNVWKPSQRKSIERVSDRARFKIIMLIKFQRLIITKFDRKIFLSYFVKRSGSPVVRGTLNVLIV